MPQHDAESSSSLPLSLDDSMSKSSPECTSSAKHRAGQACAMPSSRLHDSLSVRAMLQHCVKNTFFHAVDPEVLVTKRKRRACSEQPCRSHALAREHGPGCTGCAEHAADSPLVATTSPSCMRIPMLCRTTTYDFYEPVDLWLWPEDVLGPHPLCQFWGTCGERADMSSHPLIRRAPEVLLEPMKDAEEPPSPMALCRSRTPDLFEPMDPWSWQTDVLGQASPDLFAGSRGPHGCSETRLNKRDIACTPLTPSRSASAKRTPLDPETSLQRMMKEPWRPRRSFNGARHRLVPRDQQGLVGHLPGNAPTVPQSAATQQASRMAKELVALRRACSGWALPPGSAAGTSGITTMTLLEHATG